MNRQKMKDMSDEELREIAAKKNRVGCATVEAQEAQRILWHRANPWHGCGRTCHFDMDGRSYRGDGNENC